ncbi:MAG TPA: hypothetical protein VHU60_04945 [Gaiellaceae bacterium]|nr:hypothetical protein [Gaiellaceae bacterium]
MAEVLGDFVERASLVEEQGRAGVAEVVAAEVRDARALERGDPDAPPPVLPAQVAAGGVRKDERVRRRAALGEVEGDELARDGREELGLAGARRFRRRHLAVRERGANHEALAGAAAVVEHVAPGERVRLAGPKPLVGEHADERCVLLIELPADRLDYLGRPRVDRRSAAVAESPGADDGVPGEAPPLDGAVEDALQEAERAIDRRDAGAVESQLGAVAVDRLAGDFA